MQARRRRRCIKLFWPQVQPALPGRQEGCLQRGGGRGHPQGVQPPGRPPGCARLRGPSRAPWCCTHGELPEWYVLVQRRGLHTAGPSGVRQSVGLDRQALARQVRRRLHHRWHAPSLHACSAALEPGRARRTDNAVKNRWNSALKRETQADGDCDAACPATKRARHPECALPRLARTQSEPSAALLAGLVRGGLPRLRMLEKALRICVCQA